MTRTDQAFIEAFQRAGEPMAAASPAAQATVGARQSTLHGPHAMFGGTRAPLTEAIAQRMRRPAAPPRRHTPDCMLQVGRFAWPGAVETLVERSGEDFINLATNAITLGGGTVVGFAGVQVGSGASTTVLATARALAAQHGPVAVIDADSAGPGLASSLGVHKTRTLADAAMSAGDAGDAVVHASADRVSLIVAGRMDPRNDEAANRIAETIFQQHALVLIDFGSLLQPQAGLLGGSISAAVEVLRPAGVVVVRRESDLPGAVIDAHRAIESAGAAALGIVENRLSTL